MGPTASGKSNLSLEVADTLPCEIISVDSALVYKGMNIGTAKPTPIERQQIQHHLIDICDPVENYSVGRFYKDAVQLIEQIHQRGKIPLLVGGTMLYFYSLQFGLADLPTQDSAIRTMLTQQAQERGWEAIHQQLKIIDPVIAARIHPHDSQRIQRAMEIFLITQQKPSELQINESNFLDRFHLMNLILLPGDRAKLHKKIELRFNHMLQLGFIEEVQQLFDRGDLHQELPSIRTVGYRQAWNFLAGKYQYETMREKAIIATRQLAKRQMTWLRRWKDRTVFECESNSLISDVKFYIKGNF